MNVCIQGYLFFFFRGRFLVWPWPVSQASTVDPVFDVSLFVGSRTIACLEPGGRTWLRCTLHVAERPQRPAPQLQAVQQNWSNGCSGKRDLCQLGFRVGRRVIQSFQHPGFLHDKLQSTYYGIKQRTSVGSRGLECGAPIFRLAHPSWHPDDLRGP